MENRRIFQRSGSAAKLPFCPCYQLEQDIFQDFCFPALNQHGNQGKEAHDNKHVVSIRNQKLDNLHFEILPLRKDFAGGFWNPPPARQHVRRTCGPDSNI